MKRMNKSTLILVIIFVIGLSLMLYPVVSDYWNSFRQSRAIANYVEAVNHLDDAKYQALLQEARDYNAVLAENKNRFLFTDEEKEEFRAMLDADNGAVGYIEIKAINVKLPIYLGTKESILQSGVGAMEGTSIPVGGLGAHAVLTGHRGLPTATLFTHLDRLVEGDLFTVHVLNETMTYEVNQIRVVEPQIVTDLAIDPEQDYCTLVTCTPYGINTHRMLVRGHRVENPEDLMYVQVSTEAMQIEPLLIAPFVAAPVLLAMLIWLLTSGDKHPSEETIKEKLLSKAKKKGGNSGD